MTESTIFLCKNIGVSGSTDCHVKELPEGKFEARMGFAVMGMTQMDEADFERCAHNPFHEEFFDNYASGIGDTQEAAIAEMKKHLNEIDEGLWAF